MLLYWIDVSHIVMGAIYKAMLLGPQPYYGDTDID